MPSLFLGNFVPENLNTKIFKWISFFLAFCSVVCNTVTVALQCSLVQYSTMPSRKEYDTCKLHILVCLMIQCYILRVETEKVLYTCGHRVTEEGLGIIVTVTGTPEVSTRCLSTVLPNIRWSRGTLKCVRPPWQLPTPVEHLTTNEL